LSTVALIAFAAPAAAADLAARPYVKAPPAPIAVVYDWSGFYIGANGGWGSSRKCWDFTTPAGTFVAAEGCHDATGGTAGGQIGYRWQAGTWVFGLEGQGNWADFRGSNESLFFPRLRERIADRRLWPDHGSGRLGRQQRSVLYQGWCCRYRGSFPHPRYSHGHVVGTTGDDTRWGVWSA
jgi:outer membrane immunogenic protein